MLFSCSVICRDARDIAQCIYTIQHWVQVCRDFRGDADNALALRDMTKLREAVVDWRQKARRFLKRGNLDEDPQVARVPNKVRRKSHEWLLALDNQVFMVTGAGLEQFAVPMQCLANGGCSWISQVGNSCAWLRRAAKHIPKDTVHGKHTC